jgi:glycosyltransferase involved in cell wall biosynthesis
MPPLVSILIPCHDAAPWIEETLASARAQSSPTLRVEIIVVDDGSSDGSAEIVQKLAAPDLVLVRQPNAGAAAARQRALGLAQGDFIQYLDADDLLAPGKIARQVARLAASPGSIASARWLRFDGRPPALDTALDAPPEPNWADLSPVDYLTLTFRLGSMMHPAAWLLPRAVAGRAGAWDATLSLDDDGDYFTRAVLASSGVLHCPESLSLYRSNLAGSLSGRRSAAAWSSAFRVCEKSTAALLARSDTPRTRHACALYWLRLSFAAHPDSPALSREAEDRARRLDPSARRPAAGPGFETAARLLGWRLARRLQLLARRSRR